MRTHYLAVLFSILSGTSALAQGDYGDAPDGAPAGYPGPFSAVVAMFPTLDASGGANTSTGAQESLGGPPSLEPDANVVDLDDDDGAPQLILPLTSFPVMADLSVIVTVDSSSPNQPRFLNVLLDLNLDGQWSGVGWGGEPEWVVQNHPINVPPGQSIRVSAPSFAASSGNRLPEGAWMRLALTRVPIPASPPNGWSGTGGFTFGEIEDYQIAFPAVGGKTMPREGMCCPRKVYMNGQPNVDFSCIVYSYNLIVGAGGQQGDVFFQHMGGPPMTTLTPVSGFAPPRLGGNGVGVPADMGTSNAPFPPPPICPPPAVGVFGNTVTMNAIRPAVPGPFVSKYVYFVREIDPPPLPQPNKLVPEFEPQIVEVVFYDMPPDKRDMEQRQEY